MPSPLNLTFALSSDYARATGGWVYNQRLVNELEALGWNVRRLDLPAGYPHPGPAAVERTDALLSGLPDGAILLTDQICLSPTPALARRHGTRLRLVVVAHHPMAEEVSQAGMRHAIGSDERAALAQCALVVVTSHTTRDTLTRDYAVPAHRLVLAVPGTDPAPLSVGSGSDGVHLLAVGAVIERKAPDLLVAALAGLADLAWRLTLVGDTSRAPAMVEAVRRRAERAGLSDRIALTGSLPQGDLDALWRSADLFVSASRHEGYGMAIAEALARGVPVVTTTAGAVGDWIDRAAAVVVPVGDGAALTAALRAVIGDPVRRGALAAGARAARASLPSWPESARRIDQALRTLLSAS